ncbi:MAG TPA: 3-oxoacyl-ACP synthase III [Opitutaceae bacterium]|jgi:3-oxoacyl-[acyl-carrier-protein] synthase-3|nr:3-oxoacyl-ACP synthase III [Opitutaceae bacterium]
MKFRRVCLESIAVALPDEVWTSAAIEERLRPLYERLRLPFGRLELMTGIRERRMWPAGTRASEASARAGRAVLARSALGPRVELFIHAAVSRDMLEPATASFAHHAIGLPASAQIFDLSNACLGFLNAAAVAGAMIEAGQIGCALIACGENGRPLVEQTLRTLLEGNWDRNAIKPFFANLTIGSGAVAAVLCDETLLPPGARPHRLLGGVARAATEHSALCQGDTAAEGGLAMQTDSEQLLLAGVELARQTWADFSAATGWQPQTPDRIIGHQVGAQHRRRLFETLGLDLNRDYSTFETLGNMGSASLPATLALAAESGALRPGQRAALFGIGSGLNCMMMALEW